MLLSDIWCLRYVMHFSLRVLIKYFSARYDYPLKDFLFLVVVYSYLVMSDSSFAECESFIHTTQV